MSTITQHSLPQRLLNTAKQFIVLDDNGKVSNAKFIGQQLASYIGQVIQKDGNLRLPDETGTIRTFAASEVIALLKDQVTHILSADKDSAEEINKILDKDLGQAFIDHSGSKLVNKLIKDPNLLSGIQSSLQGIPLKSGTFNRNAQMQIFNAIFEDVAAKLEKTKPEYKPQDLIASFKEALTNEGERRGLTKEGLAEISNEMNTASMFFNAKSAAKTGLTAKNLYIDYTGEFDEAAQLKAFADGETLISTELEPVHKALANYIATVNKTKDRIGAKAQLERDLAGLQNKQKAFAKYTLDVGEKLNSDLDLDQVFNQLGNFLPGLLGSGVIGYIFSSLLGISGVWGVVGSLVMTALAATDEKATGNSQTVITNKKTPPIPEKSIAEQNLAAAI